MIDFISFKPTSQRIVTYPDRFRRMQVQLKFICDIFPHFIIIIKKDSILILLMDGLEVQQLGHDSLKLVQRAELYSKTLDRTLELPKDMSKSLIVKSQAEYQKEHILYTIKASQYQQQLYHNKESKDLETRHKFEEKLHQKDQKNLKKMKENYKIRAKKVEDYNKHLVEVGKRYTQTQSHKRTQEKEEAIKLRKQLTEFYQKEKERKSKAESHQIQVSSCYRDAVQRINNIHRKNEEFSHTSAINLERQLSKNNKFSQRISQKKRVLSQRNKQKEEVYIESICILQDKQHHHIQKCGKNQDGYLNAWDKIGKTIKEMRKKKGEETKSKLQKWKDCKHRVDEANASIPERCLSLIDKTSKAAFRKTSSTFRTTAQSFEQVVKKNKEAIRQRDDRRKDEIMDFHLDLRLRNVSTAKITERMHSLRHNAGILASEFL